MDNESKAKMKARALSSQPINFQQMSPKKGEANVAKSKLTDSAIRADEDHLLASQISTHHPFSSTSLPGSSSSSTGSTGHQRTGKSSASTAQSVVSESNMSDPASAIDSQDSLRRKRKFSKHVGLGSLLSDSGRDEKMSQASQSYRDANIENIPTQPQSHRSIANIGEDQELVPSVSSRAPVSKMASAFMTPPKYSQSSSNMPAALGERKQTGAKMTRK
jgi:hypothetical protein